MISHITIKNFALIDDLELDLSSGLNIFTGKTGVGKSILIDALRFCLGDRISAVKIRDKNKNCTIEAVFEVSAELLHSSPVLEELVSEEELMLIIRRTRLPDGRTRNKVNGLSVTLNQLKALSNLLIDFHGPHDHQMLFSRDLHLSMLDRLLPPDKNRKDYADLFARYSSLKKELCRLREMEKDRFREQDLLCARIKELEQVSLEDRAYEDLLAERSRINNAEKIFECCRELIDILENESTGLRSGLSRAFSPLKALNNIDNTTLNMLKLLENISQDSSELVSDLESYISSVSFEPEQAEEINRSYTCYYEILRKYGPDLENARKFYAQAKEKYNSLINIEQNTEDLRKNIAQCRTNLEAMAEKITGQREKTALFLKKTIEKELKELGIANIRFECKVSKEELSSSGQDRIEFYISPNLGEDLKPLAEIVSSGEAARVMLALKKALINADPVPVLIFDEIDAQIGGRLGTITGKKLKELSSGRQVILITHLPQIASFADLHLKVSKEIRDNRTFSAVYTLGKKERIQELAQMMSGKTKTQVSLEHAADMLAKAEKPAATQQGIAFSD